MRNFVILAIFCTAFLFCGCDEKKDESLAKPLVETEIPKDVPVSQTENIKIDPQNPPVPVGE